jgi:Fe-S cluster assembly iron-binding protein IscA
MREQIDRVKNWKQFLNENLDLKKFINLSENNIEGINNRIYLSQNGTDGFGYVMGIHLKSNGDKIGSIVFRKKRYLEDKGYPYVLELHIGFEDEYQKQGFFQEAIIELLKAVDVPIYVSSGRIINSNVLKAIDKLDKSFLNVKEIEYGFIISLK